MLKKLLKTIEKALFPEFSCFVCGREMKNPENGLCEKCAAKIKRIDGNICEKCGMQISDGERFCITCKNTSYVFNKARAAFVFDDISSSLVHQLKFKGKKFIVSLLACEMEKVFNSMDIKPDFIVPIPLAVKKEKNVDLINLKFWQNNCRKKSTFRFLKMLLQEKLKLLPKEGFLKKKEN